MIQLIYDGSFAGFMTTIFFIYRHKLQPAGIWRKHPEQCSMLEIRQVATNEAMSQRVIRALKSKVSGRFFETIQQIWGSGFPEVELLLFRIIRKVFNSSRSIEHHLADEDISELFRIKKIFEKEIHRIQAFVRFTKQEDGIFYAVIEPSFTVLPFIADFFSARFADQEWIIYDRLRKEGIFFNKSETCYFHQGLITSTMIHSHEGKYEDLWRTYFNAVNIPERNNPKLQQSHMPKKYWNLLTELSSGKKN